MAAVRTVAGYVLGDKLGSGLQGKVYRGVSPSGEVVALKFLRQDVVASNPRAFANLEREISAMRLVAGHPYTVGVKEVHMDVSKPKKRQAGFVKCILLVLEICPGGELFDYLMHSSRFSEITSRTYWRQMCEALSYAHARRVAHRDIKPENLLLDAQFNLRVADWGLSAVQVDVEAAVLRTQCGTKAYMAPELLRRAQYSGEMADVWSAGVVLFIMLAGFPPFQIAAPGDWWYDRVNAGQHALFWQAHERTVKFSEDAKSLLSGIFVSDPARRYRIEDCLKHPWSGKDTMSPSVLLEDMRARRRAVLCAKGLPPDVAPIDDAMSGSGGDSAGEDMSILSGSGDAFAEVVVRSFGDGDVELPRHHPALPSTMRYNATKAKAVAAAIAETTATPQLSSSFAVALPTSATIEQLPAGYNFASKVTWLFVKRGVSPLQATQAVSGYVEAQGGVARLKVGTSGSFTRVKLQVSFGALLMWNVKLFDVSSVAGCDGSCVPIGAGLLLEVDRVSGDLLGSNVEFSKLASVLYSIMQPADSKALESYGMQHVGVGESPLVMHAPSVTETAAEPSASLEKTGPASAVGDSLYAQADIPLLSTRSRTTFASDALEWV